MADLSTPFNALLAPHNTHIQHHRPLSSDTLDQFLEEAYRINAHITSLHKYLLSIRASYLSTSAPPARLTASAAGKHKRTSSRETAAARNYLSDKQRDEIDAESKSSLRDLASSIRQLESVDNIRRDTERQIAAKQFGHSHGSGAGGRIGGALGRWAAGGLSGASVVKSEEELADEARRKIFDTHRENVIWYLRRRLGAAAECQREMMERRVEREVEKSKSVLWKVKGSTGSGLDAERQGSTNDEDGFSAGRKPPAASGAGFDPTTEGERISGLSQGEVAAIEAKLSPEQLSLFAQENNDMLKRYEDTLDQIRTAEKSMIEISELQSTLAANLEIQATRIESMVDDAGNTTTNIKGGNKQLQQAAEKFRPARMVFWASCGLCAFLVTWDLFI